MSRSPATHAPHRRKLRHGSAVVAPRLQNQPAEPFVKAVTVSAAVAILPIALVWMVLAPSTVTSSQAMAPMPKVVAPKDLSGALSGFDLQDSDGTVDLYGNEVSDAVAKYRTDTAGAVYELHSPHTELPKLGSPKT